MPFEQRQIVEVQFRLPPDGNFLQHPAVIISNTEVNNIEEGFVAVMITHTNHDDEYSFSIDDKIFSKPLNDNSHQEIRLHLVSYFLDQDVILNHHGFNKMKEEYFKRMITQINSSTFDFSLSI